MNLDLVTPYATPIVFVVDDDISIRESLKSLIACEGWRSCICASACEFLAHPRVYAPSCLILDVTLPDMGGLEVQKLLSGRNDMPIIFITGYSDLPIAVRAMKAGALEFLTKPFHDDVLLGAIGEALARSDAEMRQAAEIEVLFSRYAALTGREREVMELIVAGQLNKQVAHRLGISEVTVKAHRGKLMRKMNSDSFADLVHMASKLHSGSSCREGCLPTVSEGPVAAQPFGIDQRPRARELAPSSPTKSNSCSGWREPTPAHVTSS